ncbi:MAG: hypothetical protein V2I33_19260 [Kangiellaceae bacterium]|nr:hypothetical protein [Kangiellaceae bacterium]
MNDGEGTAGVSLPAWDFATPKPKDFGGIISTPTPRRGNHSASTKASLANISPYSFESPFSEHEGELNETPRTARGLKYLTTLVK